MSKGIKIGATRGFGKTSVRGVGMQDVRDNRRWHWVGRGKKGPDPSSLGDASWSKGHSDRSNGSDKSTSDISLTAGQ